MPLSLSSFPPSRRALRRAPVRRLARSRRLSRRRAAALAAAARAGAALARDEHAPLGTPGMTSLILLFSQMQAYMKIADRLPSYCNALRKNGHNNELFESKCWDIFGNVQKNVRVQSVQSYHHPILSHPSHHHSLGRLP